MSLACPVVRSVAGRARISQAKYRSPTANMITTESQGCPKDESRKIDSSQSSQMTDTMMTGPSHLPRVNPKDAGSRGRAAA